MHERIERLRNLGIHFNSSRGRQEIAAHMEEMKVLMGITAETPSLSREDVQAIVTRNRQPSIETPESRVNRAKSQKAE